MIWDLFHAWKLQGRITERIGIWRHEPVFSRYHKLFNIADFGKMRHMLTIQELCTWFALCWTPKNLGEWNLWICYGRTIQVQQSNAKQKRCANLQKMYIYKIRSVSVCVWPFYYSVHSMTIQKIASGRYSIWWKTICGQETEVVIIFIGKDSKSIIINRWCMHHIVVNTLPRQGGRHFPDDIFKCIFLNENVWIRIKFSLEFSSYGSN